MQTILSLLSIGDIASIEVSKIVNDIFNKGALQNITAGIKGLGYIALVIYFTTKVTAVFSGSEQITAKTFGPPLIYALLLINWQTINSQLDSGLTALQKEFEASTPKDSRATAKYQEIIAEWSKVPSSGAAEIPEPPQENEEPGFWNSFGKSLWNMKEKMTDVVTIFNNPEILSLKLIMFFTHMLNTMILLLFNAFTYLWLNLLRLGGIIALALYFFPTMKNTFTNWLRTYISVYLWIPVGSIMIYVSDQIFLEIANKIGNVTIPALSPGMFVDQESLTKIIFLVTAALATCLLKLVLLSKVPAIIGYWVGGGSTGDMFSSAPTMIMMSTSAVTGAASTAGQAGAAVLTGGGSAAASGVLGGASAAGGAASKAGNSLKG